MRNVTAQKRDCNMSRITSRISEAEVLKPLKKPWMISLVQRWIREDRDHSIDLIIFKKVK